MQPPKIKGYNLRPEDFIAAGGQANIWDLQDGNVLKEYHDPKHCISQQKFGELDAIRNQYVVKPASYIKGVGYTMPKVNGFPILRLVPNGYKKQNNVDILAILKKLQKIFESVHKAGCLIVDANELNFLTNQYHKNIWSIDVDSYQTASSPATAISPTIRDYLFPGFSVDSDWYSFAVLSYWLACGCHPYKDGRTSKYKGLTTAERLEARARDLVSCYHRDVTPPKTALDPSNLPKALGRWLEDTLHYGNRNEPPVDYDTIQLLFTLSKAIVNATQFDIQKVMRFDADNIMDYYNQDGHWSSQTYQNQVVVNSVVKRDLPADALVFGSTECFAAYLEDDEIVVQNIRKGTTMRSQVPAGSRLSTDARHKDLYLAAGKSVRRLDTSFAAVGILAWEDLWDVMPNHYVSGGLPLQNMLGRYYLGHAAVAELDGHKIYDWQHQDGIVVLFSKKRGKNYETIIRLSDDSTTYDCNQTTDATYTGINFVVLSNKTVVLLSDDDILLFSGRVGGKFTRLPDTGLAGKQLVLVNSKTVGYIEGADLCQIKMKSK